MPEEDESLGAPRALAQLLKTISPPNVVVDGAKPPRYVGDGQVVGHYILDVTRHRFDQHHVCRPTEPIVADHAIGGAHQCVDRITSRHVQHRDRRAEHGQ